MDVEQMEQIGGKLERFGFRVFAIGIIAYAAGAPLLILGYYLWMGFPLLSIFSLQQSRLPAGFLTVATIWPGTIPIAGGLICTIGEFLQRRARHRTMQGENYGH